MVLTTQVFNFDDVQGTDQITIEEFMDNLGLDILVDIDVRRSNLTDCSGVKLVIYYSSETVTERVGIFDIGGTLVPIGDFYFCHFFTSNEKDKLREKLEPYYRMPAINTYNNYSFFPLQFELMTVNGTSMGVYYTLTFQGFEFYENKGRVELMCQFSPSSDQNIETSIAQEMTHYRETMNTFWTFSDSNY